MTYDEFVTSWTGKAADFDHAYGNQCVDVFNFYNRDVVGQGFVGTPTTGGAADLWNDYSSLPGYTKVANSPTGIPPKGAVVIWAANTKATGAAGHVGIASGEGDTNYFVSFDQNYPTGSLPHMQRHSYDGVLGWYVPLNQGDNQMIIGPEDNWFFRCDRTMMLVRGRHCSRDEFTKYAVGNEFLHWVEAVEDNPEADANLSAADFGRTAQPEIADLKTQSQAQQSTIDTLNAQLKTVQAALEAAKATPAPQPPSSPTPAPTTAPGSSVYVRAGNWADFFTAIQQFLGIK